MRLTSYSLAALFTTSALGIILHTLSIAPTSVVGGSNATATLRLAQDAASGPSVYAVTLSDTSIASAPATVSVPALSTITSFTISTRPVASTKTLTVTVAETSATLQIIPASLVKFTVTANNVRRGQAIKGVVSLNGQAPNAGSVVTLSVTSAHGTPAGVTVPPSVTIAAGQTTESFPITIGSAATPGTVTVTANFGRVSLKQDITVF